MARDELTHYVVEPFKSVGGYAFGTKLSDIKKKFGPPYKVEVDNIMETTTESRDACRLIFEEKRLASFEFGKSAVPVIREREIFDQDSIDFLLALDVDAIVGSRYINFRTLGVCIGGFSKKKIPEGKLVIAYAKYKVDFYDFYASE